MILVLAIVIPTTIALIYKSETKQAKFDYQNKRYMQELVNVDLDQMPQFENNFKLICGSGNVISKIPLLDDFF